MHSLLTFKPVMGHVAGISKMPDYWDTPGSDLLSVKIFDFKKPAKVIEVGRRVYTLYVSATH